MNDKLPQVPIILQNRRNECGLSALQMLFAYYGDKIVIEEIRNAQNAENFYTAKNIIEISQKYEYIAQCLRMKISELLQINFPCIVYFKGNHFVVYLGVRNRQVVYIDPAYGRRELAIEDFSKRYQNIVIIIRPSSENKEKRRSFSFDVIENHLLNVSLNIINVIFLFMLIYIMRIKESYIFAIMLVVGIIEKLGLVKTRVIVKTKNYKQNLLGLPILFFAYEENGLNTENLIKRYVDCIVEQSIILTIFLFDIYRGDFANSIQVLLLIFWWGLIQAFNRKRLLKNIITFASIIAIICINAFFLKGIQLLYSVVTIHLFLKIFMYIIKSERAKREIDSANINQYL